MSALPDAAALQAVTEATWPPRARIEIDGVTLRDGAGGGKRVSAATVRPGWTPEHLAAAEARMAEMGQTALFMVREGDEALDQALATRGYAVIDPVTVWCAPVERLTDVKLPRVTAFAIWEPLAIMRDIWAEGGIGAERLAVMERAEGPKTGIFGRIEDRPAGAGFCAISNGIAMVHALEIRESLRRKGLGQWMMRCAAHWAAAQGATHLAALCTDANAGANALYAGLGFETAGRYHYRIREETPT